MHKAALVRPVAGPGKADPARSSISQASRCLQASAGHLAAPRLQGLPSPGGPTPALAADDPAEPHSPPDQEGIGAVQGSASVLAGSKSGLRGILKRGVGLDDVCVPGIPSPHPGKRAWHWERKQGPGGRRLAGHSSGLLGMLARGCQGRPRVKE